MGVQMNSKTLEIGEAYVTALQEKDLKRIAEYLHPQVKFKSPITQASNRDQLLASIGRLISQMKSMTIKSKFASESQAMFVYDIDFGPPIGVVTAANLMTIEQQKIKEIELIFDARPFSEVAGQAPRTK
jgi:hypothetical protein